MGQILKYFNLKSLLKRSRTVQIVQNETTGSKLNEMDSRTAREVVDQNIPEAVKDKYKLVYIFFFLQGVGILLPWNMFINSQNYFTKYKFLNDPDLANRYLPLVGVISQVTNLLFIAVNMVMPLKGNLLIRAIASQSIMAIVFLITCIFPNIDTSSWSYEFFVLTMISVTLINAAVGVLQSTVYGDAGKFPRQYSNNVVTGGNFSGIFGSVLYLICLASTSSYPLVATVYFAIALVTVISCMICFLAIRYNTYYRTMGLSRTPSSEKRLSFRENIADIWHVMKLIPVPLYSVFCVFFVTLTIFPSMHANVEALDPNFGIPPKYFAAVTCFLNFNVFAFSGNVASAFFTFPSKRWVWIPITLRTLFIPLFFYSNFLPSLRTYPVYISNDYVPIFGQILLASTSGYYSSLAIMFACKSVPPEKSTVAGMLATFFLVLGVSTGVYFSMLLVNGVASWGPCTSAVRNNGTMICP